MNASNILVSFVVPVYNEEKNIPLFLQRVKSICEKQGYKYEVIFALDPCSDRSEEVILKSHSENNDIKLLKFSRRVGQPKATIAGIHHVNGDVCIVIDVDLQDPPELISQMIQKWQEGYEVVYAQRINRKGETLLKKVVSYFGYYIINKISDTTIPRNTGDFRLLSRKVVSHLKEFKEHNCFLRGLTSLVGFSQVAVLYERDPRIAGDSKYNKFLGSLTIGFNGIVGFSNYPLHLISWLGVIFSGISFMITFIYLLLKIIDYKILWGNPTVVILVSFFSGVQLLCMGILGQYIGRIYDEVKNRPLYIVDRKIGF